MSVPLVLAVVSQPVVLRCVKAWSPIWISGGVLAFLRPSPFDHYYQCLPGLETYGRHLSNDDLEIRNDE